MWRSEIKGVIKIATLTMKTDNHSLLINGRAVRTLLDLYFGESGLEKTHAFKGYKTLYKLGSAYTGELNVNICGANIRILDTWEQSEDTTIRIRRKIVIPMGAGETDSPTIGVNIALQIPVEYKTWSFFMPAACYEECPVESGGEAALEEGRLSYPLVLAYDRASKQGIVLLRVNTACLSEVPNREIGYSKFIHKTDIGGIGYIKNTNNNGPALLAFLPYREGPRSVALNKALTPVKAFYPLENGISIEVTYVLKSFEPSSYEDACFQAYSYAYSLRNTNPLNLPFSLEDALQYRMASLVSLVREWNGHTGLVLNFNPREGINAPPLGFGTSFNKLFSERYTEILEYGFTGRQLNNAYILMFLSKRLKQSNWIEFGKRIVDSFIDHCVHENGYFYTLYNTRLSGSFNPIGDPRGEWLHYGVKSAISGNYLRNMVEAAHDLCLCYSVLGKNKWLEAALKLGRFLVRIQNDDGSWYRAYSPSGEAIMEPENWFGNTLEEQKSATPIPISFLVYLYKLSNQRDFLFSAEKACEWVLENSVAESCYRGGTLDNPNVIDKEAMAYVMKALLDCYEQTSRSDYLEGAIKAGKLALTWNFLWDVPFEKGTRLGEYDFKTRGWGGINLWWAGGVVDIYSLFFIDKWIQLGEITGETVFLDVVKLIMSGTQQLLSYPKEYYGMVSIGMQEEGFASSNQGVDDGLIKKGSTWGSLGWIYAAGTYGLLSGITQLGCHNIGIE